MSSSAGSPQAARAHTSPAAELQAVLDALDLRATDEFDLVEAIKACERQIAHLHAVQARAIQELSTREDYAFCVACEDTEVTNQFHQHDRAAATGREIGAALTQPPTEASNHAGLAIELIEERRSTLAALDAGRITLTKARIIVHGLQWLNDPWLEAEVEDRLLDVAPELTEQQLRRRLNRMLMETDPDTVSKRHANSRKNRRVCPPKPDDDVTGIGSMTLVGPAEDLTALYTAVDAAARAARSNGDARNLDQLRFDLLTGLGWSALSTGMFGCQHSCGARSNTSADAPEQGASPFGAPSGCIPDQQAGEGDGTSFSSGTASGPAAPTTCFGHRLASRHGRPAQVNVTVPITTLLGLSDHPAELAGYGPIPADAARRIADDATFRRLLTDPADGRVLEYGRTTYHPPQELADFVLARDSRCVFPTCDSPSDVCDIDHGIAFDDAAPPAHPIAIRCPEAVTSTRHCTGGRSSTYRKAATGGEVLPDTPTPFHRRPLVLSCPWSRLRHDASRASILMTIRRPSSCCGAGPVEGEHLSG